MNHSLVFTKQIASDLSSHLAALSPDRIFVLTDSHLNEIYNGFSSTLPFLNDATIITIPADEANKNLQSLQHIWTSLQAHKATRQSLLINIGGGMITDIGGFSASTFKRGMRFLNIPTSLLAMVDASVGGKTGINFGGLKNEIGTFAEPETVFIDTNWLKTLNRKNRLSGYAEMLKHALIAEETMWAMLMINDFDTFTIDTLADFLPENIGIKQTIVAQDPQEQGLRKALNFGHTFGHAFEAWALMHKPILHGYAVAYGMVCELYLSVVKMGFPVLKMRQTVNYLKAHYGKLPITCDDYDTLIAFMHHDKKNDAHGINVTLLSDIGNLKINQTIDETAIKEALDFFRET